MKTLSICAFWHWRAFRYLVLPLALVVSGSLTANTAAAATTLGENEGVIIGSVMINVASPAENSSFVRGGRKLAKAKWALEIVTTKGFSFGRHVRVKTGVETHFLKKLRAGSYRFEKLAGQGTLSMFGVPLGMAFTVTPQVSTYLGRIEVTVPYRHKEGPVSVRLVDGQNETIQALEKEYSEHVKVVTKSPLIASVPATVPGKTVASPLLQRSILELIFGLDGGADKHCNQRKIVNTEILIAPASANSFTAVERWTLDRCGKPIPYKVTMSPSPRGGTDFTVVSE